MVFLALVALQPERAAILNNHSLRLGWRFRLRGQLYPEIPHILPQIQAFIPDSTGSVSKWDDIGRDGQRMG